MEERRRRGKVREKDKEKRKAERWGKKGRGSGGRK